MVGLGNPGPGYAATRHNAGFRVVEALCRRWAADGPRRAFDGEAYDARARRGGAERRILLLKPLTYMNCSGQAVRQMAAFYKADGGDMLIVLDDMALPLGRLRARAEGTAGGHKGLADVLAALGTEQVPRLRIGVGQPPPPVDAVQYVLSAFRPDEAEAIDAAVQTAAEAVEDWVFQGLAFVMEKYNRRPDAGPEQNP